MTRTTMMFLAVGVCLAALSGCGEDQAAQEAEEPAIAEEPTPDTTEAPAAENTTEAPAAENTEGSDEGMNDIREGAESIAEGAGKLFEQGKQAASEALEDAGPALDKAGETARAVGEAVDRIIERAMSDFDAAVEELNRRIEEANGDQTPVSDDPETALAPAEQLNADTKAAARAVPAGVGPAYVGVWAGEAADCKRIDQEAVEIFAVITPTTMRRHENVCNFADSVPMTDGTATIQAECIAEGSTEDRQVTFTMPSDDELRIGRPGQDAAVTLTRCHLPQ